MSEVVFLPNAAMRARRCPGAIAVLWAWEAALGAALAWPFASIVRAAYGSHPRADAVLWDRGGLPLVDLLTRRLPELGALVAHAVTVTLFAAIAGLLPAAGLLATVAFATKRGMAAARTAIQASVVAFVPCAILLAVTLVLQASLVVSAATIAGLAREGFSPTLGDVKADVVGASLLGLGLLLVALAGVTQDIARAAVVRFGSGAGDALRLAVRAVAPASIVLFWSWGWRALASLVPVAFGALLAERIGGRGGVALVAMFVIHQVIVAARVALRASWLAKAMRVADDAGSGRISP
jgi:uncharacterized membrane protein (GlpM family)